MRKTIPAINEIYCDICKTECSGANKRNQNGELILKYTIIAWDGAGAAESMKRWDLCDKCLHNLEKNIEQKLLK